MMTRYMKNLMFVQQVITMTPCDMSLYNFRCSLRLMQTWCVVPPNANRHSSQPKTEEQEAARRAWDRLNYAKNIQSKRGLEKIASMIIQCKFLVYFVLYIEFYTFFPFSFISTPLCVIANKRREMKAIWERNCYNRMTGWNEQPLGRDRTPMKQIDLKVWKNRLMS
jgi:hypothetical protein